MKRCSEHAVQQWADLKIRARASQTWPQSWTPFTKLSSTAEHKPLPPRNWIQMSRVSVSSIYTLCIFTTGKMIRMLVSSDENVWGIFFGYTKEARSLSSGVRHLSGVSLFSKNLLELLWWAHWLIFENVLYNEVISVRFRSVLEERSAKGNMQRYNCYINTNSITSITNISVSAYS